MRRERDMRHRSARTGRYVSDRRSEPDFRGIRRGRDTDYDYGIRRRERLDDYDRRDFRSRSRREERDYGEYDEECYLNDKELMQWAKELLRDIPDNEKNLFALENIEKRTKDLGIDFKYFTFEELYTSALMMYTDYRKTLGGGNVDIYIKLAKDFLDDDDLDVDGGEKLCLYYDYIVCAK